MENEDLSTRDRILHEAINLIAEKGFKNTTTKEIAAKASVSEMTIFRYFKTKGSILDEAIKQFSFEISLKKEVEEKIVWDLEKDLLLISNIYHKFTQLNEKALVIKLKEGQSTFSTDVNESPKQLKKFLVSYFSQMQKLGKMMEVDNETLAASFICTNFGFFCSNIMPGIKFIDISLDEFMDNNVKVFARGLTP
jgi:AcrR family transcriptional regulator